MGCYTQRIICNSFHLVLCFVFLFSIACSFRLFFAPLSVVRWYDLLQFGMLLMLLLLKYFISFKLLNIQKC